MKVKIEIEFDVDPKEGHFDPTEEKDVERAKSAASMAAYNNLCMTQNGLDVHDDTVEVHVDGFGPCTVTLGEDHE